MRHFIKQMLREELVWGDEPDVSNPLAIELDRVENNYSDVNQIQQELKRIEGKYASYHAEYEGDSYGVIDAIKKIIPNRLANVYDSMHPKAYNEDVNESLSLAKPVEISDEDKDVIRGLDWSKIQLDPQNEESPVNIKVTLPLKNDVSSGIALDIQLVGSGLYQIHISLSDTLKGLGLGYKIYKAVILNFGHLYSGNGRRMNTNEIPKIWDKLNGESDISCFKNNNGNLCISNKNPNKGEIMSIAGVN